MTTISLPAAWINADRFERALSTIPSPHEGVDSEVGIIVPVGCRVMIDAAVRILSFVNQLHKRGRRVWFDFQEGPSGTEGYLGRAAFFDHLPGAIEVRPDRPRISEAQLHRGENAGLVEIAAIDPSRKDLELPTRLASAIGRACDSRRDRKELEGAAWTIFAELIDNIFSHSQTTLPGFAALQVYRRGSGLKVAVSDSGLGILETIRPVLSKSQPALSRLSDMDLLIEIFRQGISRHGSERGCGLKGAAGKAVKFRGVLDLRLPRLRIVLKPGIGGYGPSTALCYEPLPLVWGTHLCFSFGLDS